MKNPDSTTPITVTPQYIFREAPLIDRDCVYVQKRLVDRMAAARIGMALVLKAGSKGGPPLPPGVKRLSINEKAAYVGEDIGQNDAGNFETRVWRPTRPVIHIACAIS